MRNFVSVPVSVMLSFCIALTCSSVFAQKAIPELWGQRVHDETKSLSAATVDQLEKQLKAYEDSTSNQIAVLIISSLDGEPIEDYSIRVAEKWKLGTKKNDNGVLILVAIDDHKMRIEAGAGLEGQLTDARSSEIVRNEMAPDFRKGDYDAGIRDAVNAIIKTIAGEYKTTPDGSGEKTSWLVTFVTAFFIFLLLLFFTWSALFSTGCAGWGLYIFLTPFYAFLPWIIVGKITAIILFFLYILGFPIAKITISRSKWGRAKIKDWAKSSSGSGRGSAGGGLLGGLGGFIGGGGGGGFSGGGGSFGGGGASGSW